MLTLPTAPVTGSEAASAAATNPRHAKLLHAAQQFEGVMLSELMKPLGRSASIDGDEAEGEAGTLQSFGVEAMAGALAKSGALGFARRIVASVEAREAKQA
jgi:flagellar protein FlgJ